MNINKIIIGTAQMGFNYSIKKKNVLFRADLNVPVVNGVITEKSRIISIKSSIKKLIERKNRIFLLSHFGRPKGIYNKKFSLDKGLKQTFHWYNKYVFSGDEVSAI